MRFLLPALCAALLALPAAAGKPEPEALPAAPQPAKPPAPSVSGDAAERLGYAFEYPRVLAQQRLFGLAHGVALLAAACMDVPSAAEGAQLAYEAWRDRQQEAIDRAIVELAAYYRPVGNVGAAWQDIAKVMHLREALPYEAASPELQAACATLPEALAQPRYDLANQFRLEELMARLLAAIDIEARHDYCDRRFGEATRRIHEARYAVWREINAPLRDEAAAILEREWPADGPAASFTDWLAEARRATRPGGTLRDCRNFSASLKQPETALRNAFQMPPAATEPTQ